MLIVHVAKFYCYRYLQRYFDGSPPRMSLRKHVIAGKKFLMDSFYQLGPSPSHLNFKLVRNKLLVM